MPACLACCGADKRNSTLTGGSKGHYFIPPQPPSIEHVIQPRLGIPTTEGKPAEVLATGSI